MDDTIESTDLQLPTVEEKVANELQSEEVSSKDGGCQVEGLERSPVPGLTDGEHGPGENPVSDAVRSGGDVAALGQPGEQVEAAAQKPVPRARRRPPATADHARASADFLAAEAAHSAALLMDQLWPEARDMELSGEQPRPREGQEGEEAAATGHRAGQPDGRASQVQHALEGATASAERAEGENTDGTSSEELLGTEPTAHLIETDEKDSEENVTVTGLLSNANQTEPQIDTFEQNMEQMTETETMTGEKRQQNYVYETADFIERERSVLLPVHVSIQESLGKEVRKLGEEGDGESSEPEMNVPTTPDITEGAQEVSVVDDGGEAQPDGHQVQDSPLTADELGKAHTTPSRDNQPVADLGLSNDSEEIGTQQLVSELDRGLSEEYVTGPCMVEQTRRDQPQLQDTGVLQLEDNLTPSQESSIPTDECRLEDHETLPSHPQLEEYTAPTDQRRVGERTLEDRLDSEEGETTGDEDQSGEHETLPDNVQSEDLVTRHQRPSEERGVPEDDDWLEKQGAAPAQLQLGETATESEGDLQEADCTPPADRPRRQVEGCGAEPAATHTDEWRPAQWEGHVSGSPAGGTAMEAAAPAPAAPLSPPPSAPRLPPDGDEFPASYTDPQPHLPATPPSPPLIDHKMDSKPPPPPVASKPWASPAAPAAPGSRRPRDDASERSVRDKIAMFSQPGAAPAPAPAPGPASASASASASPLRRRFSSAADLSSPPPAAAPATAAPLPPRGGGQLDRSRSSLDLSSPAAPTVPAAPTREQQATASLPRRTSFSGTGLLHARSQSLLDVRAHRNSIAGDPRIGQMMERRQRGLSKLRGLVIPERVPELPVLLPDLPEIKSVAPPPVSTRSSWSPSPSAPARRTSTTTTTTNWTRSDLSTAPLNRPTSWQPENLPQNQLTATKSLSATTAAPAMSWNTSTVTTRDTSRPSWSSAASVPKYSPAFKRKSLSVSSSLSSSLSSSREELRPLFDGSANSRPPPLPSSRPPPLQPPAEPKSLESIASSPTRSDISFDFKVSVGRSPAAPETDVLTSHIRGGGGDESDDSAVSSSRSSQYSPPASPLRRTVTSANDQSSYTGRVLKPKSVEAINRKNVLSSARHSSGRDLKAGSPLIQRKMPEDSIAEANSAIVTPIEDNSAIHVQEEKLHQYSQSTENLSDKSGAENLLTKAENNNVSLYRKPDVDVTVDHRNNSKQEVVEANIRRNNNSAPVSHYKTEERLFRASYSNFDQMNNTLQGKIDDRIAMVHHRTDNNSTTVIRRSMEIVTSVGTSKSTGDKQVSHWSTSREQHIGSVGDDNTSFVSKKGGDNSEVRKNLEEPSDRFDAKEKSNRFLTNINKYESEEPIKHQFATARRKFEDSDSSVRPIHQKSEESKIFPRQRKSDENSTALRRQNAIEDNILELNGNYPIIDNKSPPVAAPRHYVAQWEAALLSGMSPAESPLSPVPPSVPPKPTSKLSNGSSGSIGRQDSSSTLIKHLRGSSLDSTASDDNTLRDSVLYGSVSSLSSASSLITPQELQQLMNEANQSLDESGLCSPVTLEVVILHRDATGGGVGITLAGGADYEAKEITVHKVLAGSPAERDGRLQKGDRILSINGHSMKGVTHRESLRILKSPSAEVVLVVMKKGSEGVPSPSFEEPTQGRKVAPSRVLEQLRENTVETVSSGVLLDGNEGGPPVHLVLVKDGAGLGFSLDGGRDSPLGDRPLTVKKIFTGGAAEKQGQLKAGDELLAVAGSDVTNMTRIEAWTLMKKLPSGPVTISIRPKAAV